jgi:hypothetical protein
MNYSKTKRTQVNLITPFNLYTYNQILDYFNINN